MYGLRTHVLIMNGPGAGALHGARAPRKRLQENATPESCSGKSKEGAASKARKIDSPKIDETPAACMSCLTPRSRLEDDLRLEVVPLVDKMNGTMAVDLSIDLPPGCLPSNDNPVPSTVKVLLDHSTNEVVIKCMSATCHAMEDEDVSSAADGSPVRRALDDLQARLNRLNLAAPAADDADAKKARRKLAFDAQQIFAAALTNTPPVRASDFVPDDSDDRQAIKETRGGRGRLEEITAFEVRRNVGSLSGFKQLFPIAHGRLRVRVWISPKGDDEIGSCW